MKQTPLVSIITVNYNGCRHTLELLKSIQELTYPNIELIVVDNCSSESVDPIAEEFPLVTLVKLQKNLGFAGGNNAGIQIANGDYFYLVNNDTVLTEGCIEPLIDRIRTSPKTGMVCPKILYHEQPDIIQYAGYTPIHPITVRNKGIGFQEPDMGQYNNATETALAHGAAMFIPRSVVADVGLMAPQYFLYYEEIDYCERIKRAGYRIWYEPDSTILHKESMSVGKESTLKAYYMSRNRLLYLRRNVQWPLFAISLLYYMVIAVPKNSFVYLKKQQYRHLSAYLKGVWWNFFHFQNIHSNPPLHKIEQYENRH